MTGSTKRVLLVDDDEAVLESVGIALEERGYIVLIARDGSEGLMRAERDDPDLIILDLVMPRRSGLAVLETLHRFRRRTPPVIMLTGTAETRYRDLAAARGAEVFLAKPFDIDHLLAEVETLLGA